MKEHRYAMSLRWTGNTGEGTAAYTSYSRDHEFTASNKLHAISGSSDSHFRGDASRYNPEELLVAALASCHLLSYLHLCAVNGIVVTAYEDEAAGTMVMDADGGGHLTEVTLRPKVTISAASDRDKALHLHHDAGKLCFIARSVNFAVLHAPEIVS